MRRMVSPELMPTLAVSSYMADETVILPMPMIDKTIYAFERQVSHVAVGIDAVLVRAIKENIPMIIDGVHLVPGYYEPDPKGAIMFQFILSLRDIEQHKAHFYARGIGTSRSAERYVDNIDRIRRIQDFILERARALQIPIIDNTNLEATTDWILGIITDRLKEEMEG
jgi:2-phosphoglycerate kinase